MLHDCCSAIWLIVTQHALLASNAPSSDFYITCSTAVERVSFCNFQCQFLISPPRGPSSWGLTTDCQSRIHLSLLSCLSASLTCQHRTPPHHHLILGHALLTSSPMVATDCHYRDSAPKATHIYFVFLTIQSHYHILLEFSPYLNASPFSPPVETVVLSSPSGSEQDVEGCLLERVELQSWSLSLSAISLLLLPFCLGLYFAGGFLSPPVSQEQKQSKKKAFINTYMWTSGIF